jgi:hypothetical protein
MSISTKINIVEIKWLEKLSYECQRIFQPCHIPSHDFEHHKRVWTQAKLLLKSIENTGYIFDISFIENLIVVCFFHDTGLTINLGEDHGKASRELCRSFFNGHPNLEPEGFEEILQTIEFHENKNYTANLPASFSLLSVFAVADDADAFGYIGVYRYAEIYLMRNITPEDLAQKVLANLENRFNNIKIQYGNLKLYFSVLEQEYLKTRCFYNELKLSYSTNSQNYTSAIIHIIQKEIIENKKMPHQVWMDQLNYNNLPDTTDFIHKLLTEKNEI